MVSEDLLNFGGIDWRGMLVMPIRLGVGTYKHCRDFIQVAYLRQEKKSENCDTSHRTRPSGS